MSARNSWDTTQMPDLTGRTIVVTGANSGLGYEAALAFARKGAQVVMACRSPERASEARDLILSQHPKAALQIMELDLANLESVQRFADELLANHDALHTLVNNAGVMALPRRTTADGFEMQIGTNHFGHFALTGRLLERLLEAPDARVVNLSSTAHRIGKMHFDDLHWERSYWRWAAYGQSKLANLLFTFELQRRLEASGASLISVACHPGYAETNLQTAGPRMDGSSFMERGALLLNSVMAQSAAMGALPTLYAATSADVKGGDYIGPGSFGEVWGPPVKVGSSSRSRDHEAARKLWNISLEATGVRYEALDASEPAR